MTRDRGRAVSSWADRSLVEDLAYEVAELAAETWAAAPSSRLT
jgi:hypothetical protein